MPNLKKYNEKRNFQKTPEPIGKKQIKKTKKMKFVVQHHLARKDHYDLRLEWNGVYISFAVPKGPSFNPKDKRLAIHVEDHPLSYGNFEGIIPKGEYGGGTVMLFDKGSWYPIGSSKPDFNNGPIKFTLKGIRLKGSWSLVKYKKNNWLLIKEKDEFAGDEKIECFKRSIKTNHTMEEIAGNQSVILSSGEKIIFKTEKISKQDIFNYYKLVGNRIMPFLAHRLISAVRCPNGVEKEKFYMKHLSNESKDLGRKTIKNKQSEKSNYYYFKNINGLLSEVQRNSYE